MKTVIVKKDVVKKAAIFLLWMSMMAMAGTVSAAVYKCTGDDGKVEFSDTPCAGKDSEAMDLQYNTIGDSDGGKASKSAARSSSKKESSGSKPAKKSSAKTAKTSAANKYAKDGSERRFIGHGMTTTEVRSRIGSPDSKKTGNCREWTKGGSKGQQKTVRDNCEDCWVYEPTEGDPQTQTQVCFLNGKVSSIKKKVVR